MSISKTKTMDALLSLTADAYYKSGLVHDGVFKSNPTFAALKAKGTKQQGGVQIQVNLRYGKNTTVDSISKYGLIDTAPQDGIEPAYYSWATYAGSISIDKLSEQQNTGKPQIQKLVREQVEGLISTYSERMNEDLWDIEYTIAGPVTGNGGKNLISIPLLINGYPTNAADVGGIDQSAKTYWQNKAANSATESTATYFKLSQEMRNMYNNCMKGYGGSPDMIISNQGAYEAYETGMDTKVRYTADDTATAGFESIKFKGARMFWDEHVPDAEGDGTNGYNWDNASYSDVTGGSMYFINTKFLDLVTMVGMDFAPEGFQKMPNQLARTCLYGFAGQLVSSNRRKLGVLWGINSALTS